MVDAQDADPGFQPRPRRDLKTPAPVHKADLQIEPARTQVFLDGPHGGESIIAPVNGEGTAGEARAWMIERGVDRTYADNLVRRFGGRTLQRKRPDGEAYLCGAEFPDGSRISWRLVDGQAPDRDDYWIPADQLREMVPIPEGKELAK